MRKKYVDTGTFVNLLTAVKDEAAIMNVAEVKHVQFAVILAACCEVPLNKQKQIEECIIE